VVTSNPGPVTPVNTATNIPGKAIKVGTNAVEIAITPNGKTAYVVSPFNVNSAQGTVTPIDVATNTAGKAIGVGAFPHSIAITPNGKTAYVVEQSRLDVENVIICATALAGLTPWPRPLESENPA
jgi:DNA-binding beta-propeller fold protein YncE